MGRLIAPRFDKYISLNLTWFDVKRPLLLYVWNHEIYWGWYKYIEDDASDKSVGIKAKVEVDVGGRDTQWSEGLLPLIRELELDK